MLEGVSIVGSAKGAASPPVPELPLVEDPGQRSARAQQRITALGEMTGGIAHDFRNILAMINSGLSLAERSHAQGEPFDAYLLAAREGVVRGLRLTSRLLAFAKPEGPHLEPRNINDLIRELAVFVKYGAGPGNRVVFDLAEPLPLCLIDPAPFNAAILNLVVNARDAMLDGGEIRIRTCRLEAGPASDFAGDYVTVRVSDTGQGMSPDTVRRVFDPYFTTKGNIGTGLGVPQVKAFMQSVGGHVRVRSELGAGTSFELLFPAASNDGVVPDGLWRQLDRWTNEGGATSAPHPCPRQTTPKHAKGACRDD
jgi:signal transduction histidine kinase